MRSGIFLLFSLVSLWMIFSSGDEKTPSCAYVRLLGLEEPDLLFSLQHKPTTAKIFWGARENLLSPSERVGRRSEHMYYS